MSTRGLDAPPIRTPGPRHWTTYDRAPRSRVWRALTDANVGARVQGKIKHKGYEDCPLEITIEKMELERMFSFRWHPYPIEPGYDYSKEPTTLVEFTLEEVAEGTVLTVTESGFDQIPFARRAKAFEMNDKGWAGQMKAIDEYLNRSK